DLAPHPRLGRRADQPRGLDLVPRRGRRGALRRRRHLVADRDGRHPDHPAPWRDPLQAGLGVSGNLCLRGTWPGQARTLYGDHARFRQTYFSQYPGLYFTGDGCRRDVDGYYWITGRVDDVLNVSGHRLGTAEVESALVAHDAVAEAAVVGFPHDIKGR